MSSLQIQQQKRLPLNRCVELVLSGIQYRLFRAAVTVIIIALAVAFLMTMITESLSARTAALAIRKQTEPRNLLLFWTSRITMPLTEQQLTSELASASAGSARWREFQAWGELTDEQMQELTRVAGLQLDGGDPEATPYQPWFESLTEGQRRPLVGRAKGTEIFAWLQTQTHWEQFANSLPTIGQPFPTDLASFQAFLADWQKTKPLRDKILAGHQQAVASLRQKTNRLPPEQLFAAADAQTIEMLDERGFAITPDEMDVVRAEAAKAVSYERLGKLLGLEQIKRRLSNDRNVKLADTDTPLFFDQISSQAGANWLVDLMGSPVVRQQAASQAVELPTDMTVEQIQQAAQNWLAQQKLAKVEAGLVDVDTGGFMGFSGRTLWLIVVSFVVCVVGIANAMLMSVTERFREIATMKCLGATDGFIMINFILESCLQGTAGGIIGALLGLLLGVLRGWVSYGWVAVANLPGGDLGMAALISLGVGVLLSAMAAVYPAWIAARLAPMEAMRIE